MAAPPPVVLQPPCIYATFFSNAANDQFKRQYMTTYRHFTVTDMEAAGYHCALTTEVFFTYNLQPYVYTILFRNPDTGMLLVTALHLHDCNIGI